MSAKGEPSKAHVPRDWKCGRHNASTNRACGAGGATGIRGDGGLVVACTAGHFVLVEVTASVGFTAT